MRRPTSVVAQRPLLGVKRTWRGLVTLSANDPKRTFVFIPELTKRPDERAQRFGREYRMM